MSQSENRKRRNKMVVALSDDEKSVLHHLAEQDHCSPQEFFRRLLLTRATMKMIKKYPASEYELAQAKK